MKLPDPKVEAGWGKQAGHKPVEEKHGENVR
jgi:hypothetical protein